MRWRPWPQWCWVVRKWLLPKAQRDIAPWGGFSPIHLLSIWTLFSLVMAVYHARQGNIRQHKIWMVLLYILALLVTGVFTLWPGRVMHGVLFGV
jgi:uncharacterized membrane protein